MAIKPRLRNIIQMYNSRTSFSFILEHLNMNPTVEKS